MTMACIHYVRDRGWHPMAIFLRLVKAHAVATPWFRIYIRLYAKGDKWLLRHEIAHIRQMQREGLRFWPRYYWWMLTLGYDANPYEIEANARAARH